MPAQQSCEETSQTFSGELEHLGVDNVPLQCLYTDVCSMGNKPESEVSVQLQGYDLAGIMKTWWDGSHDWNTTVLRKAL